MEKEMEAGVVKGLYRAPCLKKILHWAPMSIDSTYIGVFGALGLRVPLLELPYSGAPVWFLSGSVLDSGEGFRYTTHEGSTYEPHHYRVIVPKGRWFGLCQVLGVRA